MGNDCSVWFNTVIRGDVNSIRIGNKVNIQDGAVLHCTYQKTTLTIGNNVLIAGHCLIIPANHKFDDILIPINSQGLIKKGIIIDKEITIILIERKKKLHFRAISY